MLFSNLFSPELLEFILSYFLDFTSKGEVCNDTCNFIRKTLVTGIDFILWITILFLISLFFLPQAPLFLAFELVMCVYSLID